MLIPLLVCLAFGVVVCVTGPAFDEHWGRRRRALDFPKVKLLTEGYGLKPCPTCGRPVDTH